MPANTGEYTTCRNCGKYVDKAEVIDGSYCCSECSQLYHFCINCGKYFVVSQVKANTCSEECAIIYKIKTAQEESWSHLKEE